MLEHASFDERVRLLRLAQAGAPDAYDRSFPVLTTAATRVVGVRIGGARAARALRNFASSNYLNLSVRPEVVEACQCAVERYGSGANGSPILNGRFEVHEALEEALARFVGTDAAMLFSAGYAANLGIMSALAGGSDVIVVDRLVHASIYDGLRLSAGRRGIFAHNDVADLCRVLQRRRQKGAGALVVTEGVFSMDGDIPPLRALVAACAEEGARIVVDDAHALGVLGPSGRGSCEHHGIAPSAIAVHMGTLSKTLAGIGGYVAGDRDVIDVLRFGARPSLFSANLPPMVAAGCLAALGIVEREGTALAAALRGRARQFRAELAARSIQAGGEVDVPIVPILLGDDERTLAAAGRLLQAGIFAHSVVFPAVPRGEARLRFMLSVGNTPEDLVAAADAVVDAIRGASA